MEILTRFLPFFRLTFFLLALPVFGLAQQFPVNNQKIVQGVGTTAQGITSYSSLPPTTNPSASTWRHVTSMHVDTVERVQYIYKRPRWYAASLLVQSNPPPATESSGSTTVDYTETIWQNTTDSTSYYYEEKQQCWQPVGTVVRDTTPVSTAATGTSAAVCYEYSLWYNSTNDSLYAYTAGDWLAIGSGGGGTAGAVDSIAVLQDSIIVGYSLGIEVTRDTIGYPVPDISDIPGLADSLAAAPSGTGTNQRIVVWTGTNSQGNSTQLQSAAGVTLDANLAFRITGGTTASRPTGAAGMMYWNTSNGWWDYHNGTAWFNPLRAATATGLGTSTHVGYFDTNGLMAGSSSFTWSESLKQLVVAGGTIPTGGNVVNITGTMPTVLSGSTYGVLLSVNGAGSSNAFSAILRATYNGGYTGAAANSVLSFYNSNTGTGTDTRINTSDSTPTGNSGFVGFAGGTTSGANYGGFAEALRGNLNIGVYGKANAAKNSATNIGVLGIGRNTGTSPVEIGGFFGLNTSAPTFVSAALVADNGASTSPIFLAKDAGSTVFSIVDGGAVATTSTLQVGTLTGTATQWLGATAGNILTTITPGYGLSLASGGVRVDTAALKAQFLPLTLSGTTEVNTAGQVLRIRDAGGYPDIYMNSNYWTAASDVNTFIDVGSTTGQIQVNSAGRTVIAAAGNLELQAGITGEMRFDGDSLVLEGVYPVGTASDSVLVRDASTGRVNLRAQSGVGTWLKPQLESASFTINSGSRYFQLGTSGDYQTQFSSGGINGLGDIGIYATGLAEYISDLMDINVSTLIDIRAPIIEYRNQSTGSGATFDLYEGSANGTNKVQFNAPASLSANTVFQLPNNDPAAGKVLTGTSTTATSWEYPAQSFFNDYDNSINLTGVTSTADTIDADSNVKSNDWGFNPTTNTYTYNGVSGRYYSVSLSAQARSSSGAELYLDVYRNGTITSAKAQAVVGGSTEPVALHGQAILLLTNGDTINAKASCSGGTEDFDIENYSLIIKEI